MKWGTQKHSKQTLQIWANSSKRHTVEELGITLGNEDKLLSFILQADIGIKIIS